MKKLTVGRFGREVSELHTTLSNAGFPVADAEVGREFFGPATRDAMRRYQAARGLQTSGELDAATAAVLARETPGGSLTAGATAAPGPSPADVRHRSGLGAAPPPVGLGTTPGRVPPGPIRGTSAGGSIGGASLGGASSSPVEPRPSMPREGRRLSGTIALQHGSPARALTVRVYHRGLGGQKRLLREGRTDDSGRYDLAYELAGAANIEVHAVGADGAEVQLSATRVGAGTEESIDLVAPSKLQPPQAEITRLMAAVSPLLDGNPGALRNAVERGERRDFTVLAGATGWDARLLALASEAHTTAEVTALPAEGVYALARLGLPTAPSRLATLSGQSVEGALRRAADAGIIPDDSVAASLAAFETFAGEQRLLRKAPGTLSNAKEFLGKAARINARDKAAFEQVARAERTGDVWTRAREAGVTDGAIDTLKLQGKLAYLTVNNAELTEHLLGKVRSDPTELIALGYYDAGAWKKTIREDLARTDSARLDALIPPAFVSATAEQRLDAYAAELGRRVAQMDPEAVTRDRIAKDKLQGVTVDAGVKTFLANAKGFRLGQSRLGPFLNQPDTPPLASLLPGMSDEDRERTLDGVRSLSALYAISPSDSALATLIAAGFRSATEVARFPYADLTRLLGSPKDGDERTNRDVLWKAQQVAATVFNVFDGAKRLGPALAMRPDLSEGQRFKIKQKLTGLFPTLENLFGTVDFCDCEECQSVLSPAAYLVDLLHFIHPDDGSSPAFAELSHRRPDIADIPLTCQNTNTALPYIDLVNEILERVVADDRTTAIQAFDTGDASSEDLVAEPQHIAWEAYVGGNGKKGLRDLVYPPALPFDLPLEMVRAFLQRLDIPLFQLRERVVSPVTLRRSDPAQADGLLDLWCERLGLGPYDVAVLTRKHAWHELFGYGDEASALAPITVANRATPAATTLRNGETLARRLGVTYVELVELLRTRFVNPGITERAVLDRLRIDVHLLDRHLDHGESLGELGARLTALRIDVNELRPLRAADVRQRTLVLRMPNAGCDFAEATLDFDALPPDPTEAMRLALLKMNLFVRLQRRLRWTTHEIDRALMALVPGVAALSFSTSDAVWSAWIETALAYFAHVENLVERGQGRVTREDVIGLWTDIPTEGVENLYQRLFESPAVLGQDPAFASRVGKVLADAGRSLEIEDHVDTIRQALQLGHGDIEPVLSLAGATDRKVTIENLSRLRRHAVLARLLSVSVAELVALLRLGDKQPVSSLASAPLDSDVKNDVPWRQTITFVREVDALAAAGLDVPSVERLCRHRGAPDELLPETDPALVALCALPRPDPAQGAQVAAWRALLAKTVAAQLGGPPGIVTRLLEGLRSDTGKPLIEEGFGDDSTTARSVRKLRKAMDLVQTLTITEDELARLLGDPAALHPDELPLAELASDAQARSLFRGLMRWIELAAARKRLGSSERLLAVLAAAMQPVDATTTAEAREKNLLDAFSALIRVPPEAIKRTLAALGIENVGAAGSFDVPKLSTPDGVVTVVDAIAAFIRIGLDPVDVVNWAGAAIDQTVAQRFRAAVKGRYSPSSWRGVAQPIFDGLRRKQRDALVAHLTHVWDGGKPRYGDTQEKLFEHLLIDPGREPIVLASRIQLAILSVQLFVNRCLMGLEDRVKPKTIDAKRWAWMERYRVWEVNRKFFIWPENWLAPEFRDDKTHLFRELEGALLQGDVDDDLVRAALQKYIHGLEGIARLEMLTMYFEPGISADGGIVHVIGRTPNAPYRYFYRRCSQGMWTPWEPLELGIEGDHLVLTAWRGRMHLFWLSFMEEPTKNPASPTEVDTSQKKIPLSSANPTTKVRLQLHWAENVRGTWTNRSSTPTFEDAPEFDGEKATTPEEKRAFFVHAKLVAVGEDGPHDDNHDDNLELHIVHNKGGSHKFVMFSKLAPPRPEAPGGAPSEPVLSVGSWSATKWSGTGPLQVTFTGDRTFTSENGASPTVQSGSTVRHTILAGGAGYKLLFPSNERLPEPERRIPAGVGTPSPVVFRPQQAIHIVYRGLDRSIQDLWGTAIGWFAQSPSVAATNDPPGASDPEPAYSDPHAYALDDRGLLCIVYAGQQSVVELSWAQTDSELGDEQELATRWLATTIYAAPSEDEEPVGRPLGGILSPQRGCVFRTRSGRILAVVEDGNGWKPEHLNANLPLARSEPSGCLMTRTELGDTVIVSRHVVYIGQDGHIHALSQEASASTWTYVNATASLSPADLPAPDAQLSAYASPSHEHIYVAYRTAAGEVREICRMVPTRDRPNVRLNILWRRDGNLPQGTKTNSGHDPVGCAFEREGSRLILYRDEPNHIRELKRHQRGQLLIYFPWTERDAAADLTPQTVPVPRLAAVADEARNRVLCCYVDEDDTLHALRYADNAWTREKLELLNPFLEPVAPLATPFFYEADATAGVDHTFFVEPYVVEKAVHEWTEWIVETKEYVELTFPSIEIIPFIPDKVLVRPDHLGLYTADKITVDVLAGALVHSRGSWIGPGGMARPVVGAGPLSRGPLVFDGRRGALATAIRRGGRP